MTVVSNVIVSLIVIFLLIGFVSVVAFGLIVFLGWFGCTLSFGLAMVIVFAALVFYVLNEDDKDQD